MTQDPNPWRDADRIAQLRDAERAPFYATVVTVTADQVEFIPIGQSTSQTGDSSVEVAESALPGDTVWCIPTGGRVFVAAVRGAAPAPVPAAPADPAVFPAARFSLANGTPDLAARGSSSAWLRMAAWAFDAATDEAVTMTFLAPPVATAWTLTVYLAPPNGNAGNVVINFDLATVAIGDQIDQADDVSGSVTVAAPGVTDQLFAVSFTGSVLDLSGQLVRLAVSRFASSGSDTYGSDIWFVGARITYA